MGRPPRFQRIMVDEHEAVSLRNPRAHGLIPAVVFIRDDGWMLAAPEGLERAAECHWSDEWRFVATAPDFTIKRYVKGVNDYGSRS